MKKIIDTDSDYCKILEENGKKFIIKYSRQIGVTREYYRSTPEDRIVKVIQNYIKIPKLVNKSNNYFVYEYKDGELLSNKYADYELVEKSIIDSIVSEICFLTKIQDSTLFDFISWNDNRSFYLFQCRNTEKVFSSYYNKMREIYDKLGISQNIFKILYNKSNLINNSRSLSIIHGDRHKKNAILNSDGEVVFIDWELGCVGDVAYDIAFHLHQMTYAKEDERYFFNALKSNYSGDFEVLLKDIDLYRLFVLVRSMIYHVYWTVKIYEENDDNFKKKQLNHFMKRYNKVSNFKEFNLSFKTEEELDLLFKDFTLQKVIK